ARNIAPGCADDEREFALVVEILGHTRTDDVSEMPGLAVGEAPEHGRILDLGAAGFLAVRLVIEPDAKNFVGVRNHRQPSDSRNRMPRSLWRRGGRLRQRAG